jgi:hypothetical protein
MLINCWGLRSVEDKDIPVASLARAQFQAASSEGTWRTGLASRRVGRQFSATACSEHTDLRDGMTGIRFEQKGLVSLTRVTRKKIWGACAVIQVCAARCVDDVVRGDMERQGKKYHDAR